MASLRPGSIINISGTTSVDDPEYRYKMPVVFGKIEGRGNGIKTVIPNVTDVATSLHRSPGEVNKFFGCELGAQTTYAADTDKAIVNGAHNDATLQSLIHKYIDAFVLCPNCRLPETIYKIKNEIIYHKCAACGAKEMVDMSHKLCTYILAQDKKAKKESKSKDKKDKKKNGDDKKKNKEEKEKKKDKKDKDDDDEKKKKKKDKKEKKDKSKKAESKGQNGDYIAEAMFGKKEKTLEDTLDDDASVDSEAGVDDAGAMRLAVSATKTFLASNAEASPEEVADVVANQQMASALKSQDKVHIFMRAAITSNFIKGKEIEKFAPVLLLLTNGNTIMERHLISAGELACAPKPKNFPVMLKQLYDEDVLQEETILEWANEGRNDYTLDDVDEDTRAELRGQAEPVVVWLQEADSDEDDDEDED